MSSGESDGYRGVSAHLLRSAGAKAGDRVAIIEFDGRVDGVLMPRYESAREDHIVIKLSSGYNIGINVSKIKSIERSSVEAGIASAPDRVQGSSKASTGLPKIALISTGGTIASKIDYRTGGVRAALTAQELYESVPELGKIADVDPEVLFSEYSENLSPSHWTEIAKEVAKKVEEGIYSGIVISHGTDTMHYTASALSFALLGLEVPVVIVGAQRSSDRPSSDAASNLLGAVTFASRSEAAGVFIAMHQNLSDDAITCHVGTRVRKNHSSRRDAFESIDLPPAAIVKADKIEMSEIWRDRISRSGKQQFKPQPKFDSKACLLKYHPGFDSKIIDHTIDLGYKALVVEGTGLGHVGRHCFSSIKKAIDSGVMVLMTSQCIWGRVRMTVYDTGRDLLDMGVIPLSDMLSETALTKAMWVLANSDSKSVRTMMQNDLAYEMSDRITL